MSRPTNLSIDRSVFRGRRPDRLTENEEGRLVCVANGYYYSLYRIKLIFSVNKLLK